MSTENETRSTDTKVQSRTTEWRSRMAILVGGLLLFETLTGLSIYLLPFSVSNQVMVLLHTLVGLVFLIPFAWYSARHWIQYRRMRLSHVVLTGYFALVAALVAVISGIVLTAQALFATRIGYGWDLAHVVSTFAVVASVVPHLVVLFVRTHRARAQEKVGPLLAAQRRFGAYTVGTSAVLIAAALAAAWAYEPPEIRNELPEDYSFLYGEDRPFAPSLATTSTGGAFDARTLGGSESCGSAGCHEEIAEEWSVSSHRWSSMDPSFQTVQSVMAEQNGPESTRYCGGCHDPISLFSGAKNVFTDDLTNLVGYQEGISCLACHAIKETDVKGNAKYVMTQPDRYMFELDEGPTAKRVSDFLIRAYPWQHVETLQRRLFKSPEFCGACHKQFIDEEINQVGWVQLQNQYDNWRKSRWHEEGDPLRTIECRECHMPLVDSRDPASGDDVDYNRTPGDRKHRSHRFLAANQFIPLLLELEGAEEQVELTEKWLRGEIEVPEIADKWREGPAVPIELVVAEEVVPGEKVSLQVVITNNKVGHDFPTGPLDIIQAWVEVVVTDQNGNVVFSTGTIDEGGFIAPGSFIFKGEAVDQYGNLVDRHNLWEMVGVRYRRAVFPGFSDNAAFEFAWPTTVLPTRGATEGTSLADGAPGEITELRVSAKLLYRKFDQFLLNFLYGEESGLRARVTVVSEDEKVIPVRTQAAAATADAEATNQ